MKGDSRYPDTGRYQFGTTHWSHVLGIHQGEQGERKHHLEWLFRQYWNPIYAYIRRFRGLSPADAEDRTQAFFAYLLQHDVLVKADPDRGRFRTFIKAVLRNFLSAEGRKDGSLKRGGGHKELSLDQPAVATDQPLEVAADGLTPDEMLDREWARRVLELSKEELKRTLQLARRTTDLEIFESYTEYGDGPQPTYSELAKRFGVSDWEVWKKLSTVREELRALLRLKVAETVRDPAEVDEELESLLALMP